ncbi:MAG: hypothetical protein K0R18_216 [Bacillales bacterium]|jgi:uncharacterized membrane protein YeaQ/YmgE (transglycosylase-associated protein family)|nr:hypothetical protein [Bacillales bacterium]
MEMVFFWLLFGLFCGLIANAKGRRVWLWVFLGILTGVVGLIIIACLPKKIKAKKVCPKCSNEILQTAIVCHYCYHDFKVEAARFKNED